MSFNKEKIESVVDGIALKGIARFSLMLVVPLSMWGISKLYDMNNAIVELRAQVTERTADRYTGTDAIRDGKAYLALISRNQQDITEIAKRQLEDEKFIYQNIRPRGH